MKPDPLLALIRSYVDRHNQTPGANQIYAAVDFRKPGGIGRLCAALEAVAEEHLADRNSIPPDQMDRETLASRLSEALRTAHGFDDGDGELIVGSPADVRRILFEALA